MIELFIFGTNKYMPEKYDDKDDLSYLERRKNVQRNIKRKIKRKKDR